MRRTGDIRALLERGKRKRMTTVDVFFAPSPVSHSRVGWVVAKHGRRIVDRNRVKRRLREIGRRQVVPHLEARGVAGDVLVRARWKAYEASFGQLAGDVMEAVEALCCGDS